MSTPDDGALFAPAPEPTAADVVAHAMEAGVVRAAELDDPAVVALAARAKLALLRAMVTGDVPVVSTYRELRQHVGPDLLGTVPTDVAGARARLSVALWLEAGIGSPADALAAEQAAHPRCGQCRMPWPRHQMDCSAPRV